MLAASRCLSFLALLASSGWLALTVPANAEPPAGPRAGTGSRQLPGPPPVAPAPAPRSEPAAPVSGAHQKGRPPKTPNARLPDGAAPQPQDLAARRAISQGPLSGEAAPRVSDPELRALSDAERILFPRLLEGFKSGWAWGDLNADAQAQGLPPVVQAMPSATSQDAALAEWLRSLTLPDLPVQMDARVVQYLTFYRDNKGGQAIAQAWVKKVGRYAAAMQAELSRVGLPKDLVWLSVIESGHNPGAQSPAGAAGMWQFVPESGRMYGLTVDRWVDERLDPQRSTQAAARYLSDLYQRFGSWELAMAAYNMGHGALLRSVRKYNTNDFWKLSRYEAGLPWETSLYVPKVFALAIVMNNKRAFGLDGITPDPAISFDSVYVQAGVPLEDVANASGIPLESLRSMNPQFLNGRVPPAAAATPKTAESAAKSWLVKLPRGTGQKTAALLSQAKHSGQYRPTLVRFGDTLASIAHRFQTNETALRTLNGIGTEEVLLAGTVLLLPSTVPAPRPDDEDIVVVPPQSHSVPGRKRVFYRVLPGDTLISIATALRVTPSELVRWNELDESAKLQSEMTLQAFVATDGDLSLVRHVSSEEARLFEAGSSDFVDYFEGLNGRKRLILVAKAGDTLAKIGQRYDLSIGMMERINRFSRSQKLQGGEQVIVYAKETGREKPEVRGAPLAQVEAPRPDALPPVE